MDFLFARAVVFFQFGFLLAFSFGAGLVFLATSESARSSSLGLLPNPIQGDFSFGRGAGNKKGVFDAVHYRWTKRQNGTG